MSKSPDADATRRAKLFWNGRSQAVRLPREFRFEGAEVVIRREGDPVILEPVGKRKWPPGYWKRVERSRTELSLGRLALLRPKLLDVALDDDR